MGRYNASKWKKWTISEECVWESGRSRSVKYLDHVLLLSQDFAHARQLFSACLELVTEFSPKLRQVMLNEMLLLEVRAHETMAAEGSKERPPPDLVSRVRGYLEMRIHGEWMEALWSCYLVVFNFLLWGCVSLWCCKLWIIYQNKHLRHMWTLLMCVVSQHHCRGIRDNL